MYRRHPKYAALMAERMEVIVKRDIRFHLLLSADGSGRGAALVAAAANVANLKRRNC